MNWKSAKLQKPEHEQEVVIRCNGAMSLAIYDAPKNGYKLADGSVCRPDFDPIEWVESKVLQKNA
jgi:hypothetical protein